MRLIFIAFISILSVSISIFGQVPANSCPTVQVIPPKELTNLGDTMTFSAKIEDITEKSKLKYVWIVSAGTVIEGQNTAMIKVATTSDLEDEFIKATVTIENFPKGCVNKTFNLGYIARIVDIFPIDTFGELSWRDQQARLQNLAISLSQNPTSEAHILLKFKKDKNSKQIKNHISKMVNHLAKFNIVKARLKFYVESGEDFSTTFYVFPKDMKSYLCEECEIIEGKDLK